METPNWRLREQMLRAGITSAAELHRRLVETYGTTISAAQISRLVSGPPERLNLQLMAEICDLLHCSLNDILVIRKDFPNDEPLQVENLAMRGIDIYQATAMAARRVERSSSYTDLEKSHAWSMAAVSAAIGDLAAAVEGLPQGLEGLVEYVASETATRRPTDA